MGSWVTVRTSRGRGVPGRVGPALPFAPRSQVAASSAPWLTLCPASTRLIRDPAAEQVRRLARGERVVLVSDRPLGRRRLRRVARRSGLEVERELLVLPGTRRALVTVDEHPAAVRMLWESVAAVPPGVTWAAAPLGAAVRLARRMPWHWTGSVLGGHVLVGRRG